MAKKTTCPDCGDPKPCRCPVATGPVPGRDAPARLTSFGLWLWERGENHSAYARRRGIGGLKRMALLAGYGRQPQRVTQFHYPMLELISADTGIPTETLIREALEAARDPTPPRKYERRRGEGNATTKSGAAD
jgi:hypothetical protein